MDFFFPSSSLVKFSHSFELLILKGCGLFAYPEPCFLFHSKIDPGFSTQLSVAVLHQGVWLRLLKETTSLHLFRGLLQVFGLLTFLLWGTAAELGEVKVLLECCALAKKRFQQLLGATGSTRPVPASRTCSPLSPIIQIWIC